MYDIEIHQFINIINNNVFVRQDIPAATLTCIILYKLSSVFCAPALTCELL